MEGGGWWAHDARHTHTHTHTYTHTHTVSYTHVHVSHPRVGPKFGFFHYSISSRAKKDLREENVDKAIEKQKTRAGKKGRIERAKKRTFLRVRRFQQRGWFCLVF